jgi:hypothetical protein
MAIARQMMGLQDAPALHETDLAHIRANMRTIMARIKERSGQINQIQEPLVDAELTPVMGKRPWPTPKWSTRSFPTI